MALYTSKKLSCYKWLCTAISTFNLAQRQLLTMPARDEDWQEIIYLGSIHGVLPRLHQQLKVSHLGLLPTDVAEALEGFYELNCLFNHRLREQIITVTLLLNSNNIRPVWLKGASMLMNHDWKTSSRSMLDLDLWIPEQNDQIKTLECLRKDGYFIQPESVGVDYSLCQHYAPVIKDGQPARLEIHRHVVSLQCASLLMDKNALKHVIWMENDGLHFGILNSDDQIMQSYLQCTEQASDCLHPRGTARLIKMVDFLDRMDSKDTLQKWFLQNSVINQHPWKQKSKQFGSHLREFFYIDIPISSDMAYLRRISFSLNFPKLEMLAYIFKHGLYLFVNGRLGKINTWPRKIKGQLMILKNSGLKKPLSHVDLTGQQDNI